MYLFPHLPSISVEVICLQVVPQGDQRALGTGSRHSSVQEPQHVQEVLSNIVVLLQKQHQSCVVLEHPNVIKDPGKFRIVTPKIPVLKVC